MCACISEISKQEKPLISSNYLWDGSDDKDMTGTHATATVGWGSVGWGGVGWMDNVVCCVEVIYSVCVVVVWYDVVQSSVVK